MDMVLETEMDSALGEWENDVELSRIVKGTSRPGRLWTDLDGRWWCVTGSEPVVVRGVRHGHRETSRIATDAEVARQAVGAQRLLAVLRSGDGDV